MTPYKNTNDPAAPDTIPGLHRPIFIIGYMAAGKTTFGRALARQLGREFIDLDFRITQRFHASVARIFSSFGEAHFREMESAMLRETGEFCDVVISCGGGTPCIPGNMEFMLSHGTVVWLSASVECMARRVAAAPGKRPLLDGLQAEALESKIRDGLLTRIPHYKRAHIHFDGEQLEDRRQIKDTVDKFIRLHRSEL